MRLLLAPLAILLAIPLSAAAHGNDVWVDPVLGDDSNPGTALAPFRTISAAVSLPDATVNLVPGVYSGASGETFPIALEGADSIFASGNASNTRIVLPDVGALPGYASIMALGANLVSGVTLEQLGSATIALKVLNPPNVFVGTELTVSDSIVLGGSIGVVCFQGQLSALRSQLIGQDFAGVSISQGSSLVQDVTIRGAQYGVFAEMRSGTLHLERVSILDVQHTAVQVYNSHYASQVQVWVDDCLIAGHWAGVYLDHVSGPASVRVRGCTIVSDQGWGVYRGGGGTGDISVTHTIIAGHSNGDVRYVNSLSHSLVEDDSSSTYSGPGNLTGDPMFVDRARGDYRLGWGSPCIDTADSGLRADLLRHPRVVDGDLQLIGSPDIGALEHRTLSGPKSIRLGQPIPLEVTGPAGGFSTVVVSPPGYAASAVTTPYGRFFLDLTNNFRLPSVPTLGVTPTQLATPSIVDSSLVGTQIGIQALTRSLDAPAGGAFSQPILVRIDP